MSGAAAVRSADFADFRCNRTNVGFCVLLPYSKLNIMCLLRTE